MKKIKNYRRLVAAFVLVLTLMLLAFTACGGNNNDDDTRPAYSEENGGGRPADENREPADDSGRQDDPPARDNGAGNDAPIVTGDAAVDEYIEDMMFIIDLFEDEMDVLLFLVEILEHIETDEEFLEWYEEFLGIMNLLHIVALDMVDYLDEVPVEFLEAHILAAAAVELVVESMLALDFALADAIMGDYDAMLVGVETFIVNLFTADMFWEEAMALFFG